MNFKVYPTPYFKKLFKKLLKKYPSLKNDLQDIIEILSENPDTGIHLGNNIFKIRLSIGSKGKGKSGGARIITYVVTENNEVYLVFIYDKSQLDNISKQQVSVLVKRAGLT
jgi:hypothetical protein